MAEKITEKKEVSTGTTEKEAVVTKVATEKVATESTEKVALKTEKKVKAEVASEKVVPVKKEKTETAKKSETPKKAKGVKKTAPYVSNGELCVELVHSIASCTKKQIRTVQALGLRKINDTHVHKDNPAIQGMIKIVAHLVKVEKVS